MQAYLSVPLVIIFNVGVTLSDRLVTCTAAGVEGFIGRLAIASAGGKEESTGTLGIALVIESESLRAVGLKGLRWSD